MKITIPDSLHFLQPVAVPLIRFGSHHDGGYVGSPKCVRPNSVVISLGLKDNWSFEDAHYRAAPNVTVRSYDPTVSTWVFIRSVFVGFRKLLMFQDLTLWGRSKILAGYLTFYRGKDRKHYRLWVKANSDLPNSISLAEILNQTEGKDVVLKIDIEGDEYQVLKELRSNPDRRRVLALFVEFHDIDQRWDEFVELLESLKPDFSLIHLHVNNFNKVLTTLGVPRVLELSFLRNDLVESEGLRSRLPIANLDFPNDLGREDFEISFD